MRARYSRGASMIELPSICRNDAARIGFFGSMATEMRPRCLRSTSELAIVERVVGECPWRPHPCTAALQHRRTNAPGKRRARRTSRGQEQLPMARREQSSADYIRGSGAGVCSGVTQAATKQHKGNFRMVDGSQCWRGETMEPRGLLGCWTQGKTKSRRCRGYVSGECGGEQCKADSGIWRANDAKETEGL